MPHLTPDQLAEYERDGVVRLRAFLSADEVAAVRAELERFVREDLAALPADARTLEADGRTVRNLWRLEQPAHPLHIESRVCFFQDERKPVIRDSGCDQFRLLAGARRPWLNEA